MLTVVNTGFHYHMGMALVLEFNGLYLSKSGMIYILGISSRGGCVRLLTEAAAGEEGSLDH